MALRLVRSATRGSRQARWEHVVASVSWANSFASPDHTPIFIQCSGSPDSPSSPASSSLPRISAGLPWPRIAACP
jgi:hypothetical protein